MIVKIHRPARLGILNPKAHAHNRNKSFQQMIAFTHVAAYFTDGQDHIFAEVEQKTSDRPFEIIAVLQGFDW